LFNTAPLADFFLHGNWKQEVNKDNPLGNQGELAQAFSELLGNFNSGRSRQERKVRQIPIDPSTFKSKLDTFAEHFAGGGQQDAHELLSFVLDGLHEDLNRVVKKPYVQVQHGSSVIFHIGLLQQHRSRGFLSGLVLSILVLHAGISSASRKAPCNSCSRIMAKPPTKE
jgi:ubiquitin C-terminal hydrolase